MTTSHESQECVHGLEPMWCSYCRKKLGYRAGSDRQHNDCTVVAVQNVTGATYEEAAQLLADAGRKGGQGTSSDVLKRAVEAAGWKVRVWAGMSTAQAFELSRRDGESFLVCAWRRSGGHAFSIVNGYAENAGRYLEAGTRYLVMAVN